MSLYDESCISAVVIGKEIVLESKSKQTKQEVENTKISQRFPGRKINRKCCRLQQQFIIRFLLSIIICIFKEFENPSVEKKTLSSVI